MESLWVADGALMMRIEKKLPKGYIIPELPTIKKRDDSEEISNFYKY